MRKQFCGIQEGEMSFKVAYLVAVVLAAMFAGAGVTVAAGPLEVPFESERHRIILPTSINGSASLRLILDTGMRFDGVYLFHEEQADLIDTSGAIEVRVPGAGAGEASTAIMIETGRLTFGAVTVDSQKVLIARSKHTQGFPTDGVIGWNLFGHYIVEIDHDRGLILLHDSTYVPSDSGWTELPITLKKDIPWLEVTAEVNEGVPVMLTAYIDLAAGDVLELLTREGQKFTVPEGLEERYLGTGLSGDIHGQVGRIVSVSLAGFTLNDVPVSFTPAEVRSRQEDAEAVLGNGCLERFNVVFDYYHQRLFLRPNNYFDQQFE